MSNGSEGRILVIRGGALGDFILTLPGLSLLREAFPAVHLEILGYPQIACLAERRFYANAVRSVNQRPVASFYAKNGDLDESWREYFGSFQQVISYLYDPDQIFEENLRRCGVKHYLAAFRKVTRRHAAIEWAEPLEGLALFLEDPAARVHLTATDREGARAWLGPEDHPRWVFHPGSGSPSKNWPVAGWTMLARKFLKRFPDGEIILVSGEADVLEVRAMVSEFSPRQVRVAHQLPLPLLGAVLAEVGRFLGHDTGVAHLAAAVGAKGLLLFGPTSPEIWAPKNSGIRVLKAMDGDWSRLSPGGVWQSAREHFEL